MCFVVVVFVKKNTTFLSKICSWYFIISMRWFGNISAARACEVNLIQIKQFNTVCIGQHIIYLWHKVKHILIMLCIFTRISFLPNYIFLIQKALLFYYPKVSNIELYKSWKRHRNVTTVPTKTLPKTKMMIFSKIREWFCWLSVKVCRYLTMLTHTVIAVWLWQFQMGLNIDEFCPLRLGCI